MRTLPWVVVAGLSVVAAACGDASTANINGAVLAPPISDGGGGVTPLGDGGALGPAGTWDDNAAIAWLNAKCVTCHGIDDTGTQMPYYSAWPMPKPLTREWLETSDYTAAAYQTVLHRSLDVKGPPSPMPVEVASTDQQKRELLSALDWFTRRVPFSVIDANRRYGNKADTQQQVAARFECTKRVSLRQFLTSVTLGVFDRYPTPTELAFFGNEVNAPVTPQAREHIAAWFDTTWKQEFLNVGLRKLANVIGGAPQITSMTGIDVAQAADLKEEFYRQLLAHYDDWSYGDFFKTNTVMVTDKTAALYGCNPPPAGTWASCQMPAPRKTFFTTRGYLVSKPSSFLVQNNNYGRVALIFFTLYGEKLFAATNGPTGDSIPPLPNCLEGDDTRTFTGAPRGTAAVPMAGAVCQGCHVARGLAAGSVLFRPYARNGSIYDPATIGMATNPDKKLWDEFFNQTVDGKVVETLWGYLTPGQPASQPPQPVSEQYMKDLLTWRGQPPRSCVATGNKQTPFVTVTDIEQLVTEYLKNTTSFSRGFTRHAQRAFMNQSAVTLEMSVRASTAFDQNKQKIPDLLKAYFLSDTLTCEE